MSCIHYKFKSSLDYFSVTFDGLHLSLGDLKKSIATQKRLKPGEFDLEITNAQTGDVYKKNDELIAKNTSVIVSRVPIVKSAASSTQKSWEAFKQECAAKVEKEKQKNLEKLRQASEEAASASASEIEKIKAVIDQSTKGFEQASLLGKQHPPENYVCKKCGHKGHWYQYCPNKPEERIVEPRIKRTTGIPATMLTLVDDPLHPGALLTHTGHFAVPKVDAEAYRENKKERPPFLPPEEYQREEIRKVPQELLCHICEDLCVDAAIAPCCGTSFCDECLREELLEDEDQQCPSCKETNVSPDRIVPNQSLRKAVENFLNDTGYTKVKRRKSASKDDLPKMEDGVTSDQSAVVSSTVPSTETSPTEASNSPGSPKDISAPTTSTVESISNMKTIPSTSSIDASRPYHSRGYKSYTSERYHYNRFPKPHKPYDYRQNRDPYMPMNTNILAQNTDLDRLSTLPPKSGSVDLPNFRFPPPNMSSMTSNDPDRLPTQPVPIVTVPPPGVTPFTALGAYAPYSSGLSTGGTAPLPLSKDEFYRIQKSMQTKKINDVFDSFAEYTRSRDPEKKRSKSRSPDSKSKKENRSKSPPSPESGEAPQSKYPAVGDSKSPKSVVLSKDLPTDGERKSRSKSKSLDRYSGGSLSDLANMTPERSKSPQRKVSMSPKRLSKSPIRRKASLSPKPKSPIRRRSRSFTPRKSFSPYRRSSPYRRKSPYSPGRRKPSYSPRRSLSPLRRRDSRSPYSKRSKSPYKRYSRSRSKSYGKRRSLTPRRSPKSRYSPKYSPRRRSISPRRRSISPRPVPRYRSRTRSRTRSPFGKRRSRSPYRRSVSPYSKALSPQRRRSRSPYYSRAGYQNRNRGGTRRYSPPKVEPKTTMMPSQVNLPPVPYLPGMGIPPPEEFFRNNPAGYEEFLRNIYSQMGWTPNSGIPMPQAFTSVAHPRQHWDSQPVASLPPAKESRESDRMYRDKRDRDYKYGRDRNPEKSRRDQPKEYYSRDQPKEYYSRDQSKDYYSRNYNRDRDEKKDDRRKEREKPQERKKSPTKKTKEMEKDKVKEMEKDKVKEMEKDKVKEIEKDKAKEIEKDKAKERKKSEKKLKAKRNSKSEKPSTQVEETVPNSSDTDKKSKVDENDAKDEQLEGTRKDSEVSKSMEYENIDSKPSTEKQEPASENLNEQVKSSDVSSEAQVQPTDVQNKTSAVKGKKVAGKKKGLGLKKKNKETFGVKGEKKIKKIKKKKILSSDADTKTKPKTKKLKKIVGDVTKEILEDVAPSNDIPVEKVEQNPLIPKEEPSVIANPVDDSFEKPDYPPDADERKQAETDESFDLVDAQKDKDKFPEMPELSKWEREDYDILDAIDQPKQITPPKMMLPRSVVDKAEKFLASKPMKNTVVATATSHSPSKTDEDKSPDHAFNENLDNKKSDKETSDKKDNKLPERKETMEKKGLRNTERKDKAQEVKSTEYRKSSDQYSERRKSPSARYGRKVVLEDKKDRRTTDLQITVKADRRDRRYTGDKHPLDSHKNRRQSTYDYEEDQRSVVRSSSFEKEFKKLDRHSKEKPNSRQRHSSNEDIKKKEPASKKEKRDKAYGESKEKPLKDLRQKLVEKSSGKSAIIERKSSVMDESEFVPDYEDLAPDTDDLKQAAGEEVKKRKRGSDQEDENEESSEGKTKKLKKKHKHKEKKEKHKKNKKKKHKKKKSKEKDETEATEN